jgi:hypothetical protein
MMPRRTETPFDKIMTARTKLDMFVRYGDVALKDQSFADFAAEINEAFGFLMDFRNMVQGMAKFSEAPGLAVIPYMSRDQLAAAGEAA